MTPFSTLPSPSDGVLLPRASQFARLRWSDVPIVGRHVLPGDVTLLRCSLTSPFLGTNRFLPPSCPPGHVVFSSNGLCFRCWHSLVRATNCSAPTIFILSSSSLHVARARHCTPKTNVAVCSASKIYFSIVVDFFSPRKPRTTTV